MAAGRFIVGPYFPARDRDGQLQAGALLYVYENGTTTKATIYTDEGLSVLSPNPVVANSSGQFSAVWGEAGTESVPVPYTVQITSSTGASLGNPSTFDDFYPSLNWENANITLAEAAAVAAEGFADDAETSATEAAADAVQTAADLAAIEEIAADAPDAPSVANKLNKNGDNVGSNAATLRTNIGAVGSVALADDTGASLVGYANADVSGADRTVTSRLEDRISILDVVPASEVAAIKARTSTYNIASVLQTLINTLSADGGGEIWFPAGTYILNTSVALKTGVTLRAAEAIGSESTILRSTSAVSAMLTIAADQENCAVIGLWFYGYLSGTTYSAGIENSGVATYIRACRFFLFNDAAIWHKSGSISAQVQSCFGYSCAQNYARSSRSGAYIVDGTDHYTTNSQFGCAQNYLPPGGTPGVPPGVQSITSSNLYNAGIYVVGSNCWFIACTGENADVSFYLETTSGFCRFIGCRADQVWGNGVINAGGNHVWSNLFVENVSLNSDGGFSGVKTTGTHNKYNGVNGRAIARFPEGAPTLKTPSYAFEDTASNSQINLRNTYFQCDGPYLTALYTFSGVNGASAIEAPLVSSQTGTTLDSNGTTYIALTHGSATTVTAIDGGYDGKSLTLHPTTGNVTLQNNATIVTNIGADMKLVSGRNYVATFYSGKWYLGGGSQRVNLSLTPASVGANTSAEQSFSVPGLTSNDTVVITPPAPTAGTGIVSVRTGADLVYITWGNFTGGSLTPAAGTYRLQIVGTSE